MGNNWYRFFLKTHVADVSFHMNAGSSFEHETIDRAKVKVEVNTGTFGFYLE